MGINEPDGELKDCILIKATCRLITGEYNDNDGDYGHSSNDYVNKLGRNATSGATVHTRVHISTRGKNTRLIIMVTGCVREVCCVT